MTTIRGMYRDGLPHRTNEYRTARGALAFPATPAVPAYDQYWDNVVLLLRFDSTMQELSGVPETTAITGSGVHSAGIVTFAGPNSSFPTTSYYNSNNVSGLDQHKVVATDNGVAYSFPAGTDFTMETWCYPVAIINASPIFGGFQNYATTGSWTVHMTTGGGIGIICGEGPTFLYSSATGYLNVNAWNHVAAVRSGSTAYVFVNGRLAVSGSFAKQMGIGTGNDTIELSGSIASDNFDFRGYFQECRVTRGVARYTSPFSLSLVSAPFPSVGPTVTDTYFSSVGSLLHMNGSNGSTTFTDVKGKTWTPTNATISTAQSKYGGASMIATSSGFQLMSPTHADFAFGTGDFTIECWARMSTSLTGNRPFFGWHGSWMAYWAGGSSQWAVYNGATNSISGSTPAGATNTWYHIAVTRSGTTMRLFVNGILVGSATVSTDFTGQVCSAGCRVDGTSNSLDGYIDELRITKGVARYTASFVPPGVPYLDA